MEDISERAGCCNSYVSINLSVLGLGLGHQPNKAIEITYELTLTQLVEAQLPNISGVHVFRNAAQVIVQTNSIGIVGPSWTQPRPNSMFPGLESMHTEWR